MTKLEKITEMVNASKVEDKDRVIAIIYRKKPKKIYKAYDMFKSGLVDADFCVIGLAGFNDTSK